MKGFVIALVTLLAAGAAFAADLENGKMLYEAQCATCHGPEGKGDGPGAAALETPPRDLTACGRMELFEDEDLEKTISEGRGEMPPWEMLGEEAIEDLVTYIRSFCGKS